MEQILRELVRSKTNITVYVTGSDVGLRGAVQDVDNGVLEIGSNMYISIAHITAIEVEE